MTELRRIRVPADRGGERLDRFLSGAFPDLSRSRVRRLIDEGFVSIPGVSVRPSTRTRGGEEVSLRIPPLRPLELVPEPLPVPVLYEDDHLMVVEKPAGVVVHPSPGHSTGTLVHALLSRADRLSGIGGVERPGIVHRLDRDTSGILVVAKNDPAHADLSAQLSSHRMDRRYHGIVWGRPPRSSGVVRTRIGRHPVHRKKMAVLPDPAPEGGGSRAEAAGRIAGTRYRCLDSIGGFTRVEFRLETGRTHQVRVHCAHLGCPIVGDDVYGRSRRIRLPGVAPFRLSRFLLHAFHLGFRHPATGEPMEFSVPDPPEFGRFLEAVREATE
ncbi:MAG: RluA family pseudouridine synthase [Deltaproteobacteria bacterium]